MFCGRISRYCVVHKTLCLIDVFPLSTHPIRAYYTVRANSRRLAAVVNSKDSINLLKLKRHTRAKKKNKWEKNNFSKEEKCKKGRQQSSSSDDNKMKVKKMKSHLMTKISAKVVVRITTPPESKPTAFSALRVINGFTKTAKSTQTFAIYVANSNKRSELIYRKCTAGLLIL